MGVALVLLARAWATVAGPGVERPRLVRAFYLSQLAKYLPGGIWQPAGLVLGAGDDAASRRRAAAAFVVFAGVYAGVGLGLGGPLVAATTPDRRVAVLGGLGLLAGWRPAWLALLRLVPARFRARVPVDAVPPAERLAAAATLAAAGLAAWGAAYALLVAPLAPPVGAPAAIGAAVVAWALGFVAVPVPAGAGVREAALVAVLPGAAAPVVAASVLHRAAGLAAELVLAATSALGGRGEDS